MRSFRLLPLLVLVALLVFAVRFGETMTSVKNFNADANAAATADDKKVDDKKAEKPHDATVDKPVVPVPEKPTEPSVPEPVAPAAEKPALTLPEVWSSSTDEALQTSPARENLLLELTKRRDELDKRDAALAQREALLTAAQKQMDAKMADMAKLKADLEQLLGAQSEADMAQTKALVKIYEGMKPKDAAQIFDQLDMDLLVSIASGMSTLRVSPILAQMNTEKARDLTMRLSERKKIPDGPATPTANPQTQNLNGGLGTPATIPGIDGPATPTAAQ